MRVRPSESTLVAPVAVRLLDADEVQDLELGRAGAPYRTAIVIRMVEGRPTGQFVFSVGSEQRIDAADLKRAFASARVPPAPGVAAVLSPPSFSVIVCTCAKTDSLLRTVDSLLACRPGPLEVIVVENRPVGSPVRTALDRRYGPHSRIRYVEESRVGLAAARNAGLTVANGEVIVCTDDDVLVDTHWLRSIGSAFAAEPDAGCVTGLILPHDLETSDQVRIEQFAGFGKGFERRTYRALEPTSPLFPFAAGEFGSGASIAMRADVALALGGFDPALGTGTIARGGEDLDFFVRVLLAGYALVYEPAAMLWHEHPVGAQRLNREAFGYGVGLSAMLTKHALGGHGLTMLRRGPAAWRFMRDPGSRKNIRKAVDYPRYLDWLELAGMAAGPLAYLESRRRQRISATPPQSCSYRPA